MTEQAGPELERGFRITDYDPVSKVVKINLDRGLLERSGNAVAQRCVDIIRSGVSGLCIELRGHE